MRTTVNIEDDVLERVKALANSQRRPVGDVLSDFARDMLDRPQERQYRNGIPLLPSRGARITLDMVNRARDEED